MTIALRLLGVLLAFVLVALLLPWALTALEERFILRPLRRAGLQPCSRLFSPRIPCRNPEAISVGGWMLACSQWAPAVAACKANGSGSPHD